MRALLIAPIQPAATGLGLAMRMGLIAEALSRVAALDVAIVPVAGMLSVPDNLLERLGATVHQIDLAGGGDTALTLMSAVPDPARRLEAFIRYGKPSLTGLVGPRLRTRIAALMAESDPDIVVIGRAYLAHLADLVPERARVVVDLDEDDMRSCASQARERRRADPIGAQWLVQEGEATRRLIDRAASRIALTLAAAPADAIALRRRHPGLPVACIPNAVRRPAARAGRSIGGMASQGPTILFIGALGYEPNIRGIFWFARTVMPRLRRVFPSLRLLIAGARPDPRLRWLARAPGISLFADPVSIDPLYAQASLVVAPLFDGGGTRIKLIEAAARGKRVVATSVAMAGLGALPDIVCAPALAGPFARACLLALERQDGPSSPQIPRRFDAAFAIPALAQRLAKLTDPVPL